MSSTTLLKEMVCRQVQLSQDQTLSSLLRLQPGAAYLKELLNIRLVGALAIQEKEAGERLSSMRTPMVEALRRTIIMEIY